MEVYVSNKRKKLFNLIYGRTLIILILIIIQLAILFITFNWLKGDFAYLYNGFNLLTSILIIYILNKKENPSFKLAWIIPILIFPVFGTLFY